MSVTLFWLSAAELERLRWRDSAGPTKPQDVISYDLQMTAGYRVLGENTCTPLLLLLHTERKKKADSVYLVWNADCHYGKTL